MSATPHHRAAAATDLPRIRTFLKDNGLPTNGVEKSLENFVVAVDHEGSWVGIGGFERYGENCLVRSVAVDKRFRGRGHGLTLVDVVLRSAKSKGVKTAYLLTEDASRFFESLGFEIVDRKDIDEAVKASLQFTEAACDTAVPMRKAIG